MRRQRVFVFPAVFVIVSAIVLMFGLLMAAAPGAAQDVKVKLVPIVYTHPDQGREMYTTYCAPCHGLNGDGKGPAAPAFKYAPTNLTTLAKTHGGTYPSLKVIVTIQMGPNVKAHGSAQMPVWGNAFRSLDHSDNQLTFMRIRSLTDYIRTLQK